MFGMAGRILHNEYGLISAHMYTRPGFVFKAPLIRDQSPVGGPIDLIGQAQSTVR